MGGLIHVSEVSAEAEQLLDVKGENCPMPLLKAKLALNKMAPGARLRVLATDPGSVRDFQIFAQQSGNSLLDAGQDGDVYFHVLRKKPAPAPDA